MRKRLTKVATSISTLLLFSACSMLRSENFRDVSALPQVITQDVEDSRGVLEQLENADEIVLQKRLISWGDRWAVRVDGDTVAEVRGQPIYLIGDTYSMFSSAGNLVGSEGEAFRLVLNEARIYDYLNEQVGTIRQNFTLLLYNFEFFDIDGNMVGSLQQNFALALNANINNPDDSCAFNIRKDLLSIGARLRVTRCSPAENTEIPAINAVWMALILNEIDESSNNNNNSSNNNSSDT